MDLTSFIQLLVAGIGVGAAYGLVALGLNVLVNTTDVVNVAHGEFYVVGAVIAVSLYSVGLPVPLVIVLSALATAAVAIVIGRLTLVPMLERGVPSITVVILTIGLSIVLSQAVSLIWGKQTLRPERWSGDGTIDVGGVFIDPQVLWVLGSAVVVMVALRLFFARTKLGFAMTATAVNRLAAQLVGINTRVVTLAAIGLSALLGGLAGVAVAPITGVGFLTGLVVLLKGFTAATIGGLGNATGAMVGGLVLGIVESLTASYISPGWSNFIVFGILLVALTARPQGLFGTRLAQ